MGQIINEYLPLSQIMLGAVYSLNYNYSMLQQECKNLFLTGNHDWSILSSEKPLEFQSVSINVDKAFDYFRINTYKLFQAKHEIRYIPVRFF